jgi:hypothetical protein
VFSYQTAARSFHPGLNCPMSHNFFSRRQPFSCFSRPIALYTSSKLCQCTRRRGVVLICESLRPVRFVLKNAAVQIVSHSNVEAPTGATLEDVNVEVIFTGHTSKLSDWIGKRSVADHPQIVIIRKNTRSLGLPSLALGTALGMTSF